MMQRSTWVALIMVVVFVVCIVPAVWLGVINGFFDGDVVGQLRCCSRTPGSWSSVP